MKRKTGSILLSCVLGAALLGGCTITISPASPGTSSDTAVQSEPQTEETPSSGDPATPVPTASPQAAQPTATPAPQPTEPPAEPSAVPSTGDASGDGQEYTDLSFLSQEQQNIYQRALEASMFLFDVPSNLDKSIFHEQIGDSSYVVLDGHVYDLYENSYREFQDYVYTIFTPHYIESLGTFYTDKFINYDGYLATSTDGELMRPYVDGISRDVMETYPDTYRLDSLDDKTVRFTLISHYDRNWDTQSDMDVFTIEYPICLVNTELGWRVDEFHTTLHG